MSHVDEGTLHAYLDGALPAGADRRALEVHLVSCASCRTAFEEARTLRDKSAEILQRAVPVSQTPPPFEEIVARAEAREGGHGSKRAWRWRGLAWAATILMAAGLGSYVTLSVQSRDAPVVATRAMEAAPETERLAQQQEAAEPTVGLSVDPPAAQPARPAAAPGLASGVAAEVANAAEAKTSADVPTDIRVARAESTPLATPTEGFRGRLAAAGDSAAEADTAVQTVTVRARTAEVTALAEAPPRPAQAAALEDTRRADAQPTDWVDAGEAEAAEALGGRVARVSALSVIGYATRQNEGRSEVRVRQRTPDGVDLELVQWRAGDGDLSSELERREIGDDSLAVVTVRRGEFAILARAKLPIDSLRQLLGRIP